MIENEEKTTSVRITEKLLGHLKDEQYAERKRGEKESTYAELLDRAWKASTASENHAVKSGKRTLEIPADVMEILDELMGLRDSDDPEDKDVYRTLRKTVGYLISRRRESEKPSEPKTAPASARK